MTDDELAEELEFHAKHGSHAYPPLLYAAADRLYAAAGRIYAAAGRIHAAEERIYAISAKCALLGASLAQAEREADAVAASEPFGHFRALPMGWEDCAETDEGAIPLYEHPAPVASAAPECSASEVGIQTSEPRAWAHFVKNGNIRIWTSAAKEAVRIAKENGIELTPLYTEPQPDRVAELDKKVRELEAIAEARLRDLNSAGDALADAGYTDEGQPLWADIAKLAGERDAAKAEVERLRDRLEYARNYVQSLVDHGESVHAAGLVRDLDSAMVGKEAQG